MMSFRRPSMFPVLALGILLTGVGSPRSATAEDELSGGLRQLWVYVGTYSFGASKGIYLCRLDLASGKLESEGLVAESANPTFLAHHPSRPVLYALNEIAKFDGKPVGSVSALRIEPRTGKLTLLNRQSSGGPGPCHLAVDSSGRCVLVANYLGGSVACLPIAADGRLDEPTSIIRHAGFSVNKKRQEGPHAHCIMLDAANRIALAADLGIDKIMIYRFDARGAAITANEPAWFDAAPGAGPRHVAFHPNGRYVYVINELNSTVTALRYDAARGTLETLQNISTLPEGFTSPNTAAEVQIDRSGKFLYGSNRGHNSLATFAVDPATGRLTALGHESTRGKSPRHFAIDPTGRWLLAANQDSNNVVVYRIDAASGRPQPVGPSVSVPAPVCIEMLRPVDGP